MFGTLRIWVAWLLIAVPAVTCHAVDKSWNAGSGDWSTTFNWSPFGIPSTGDNVTIGDLTGTTTAIVSADFASVDSINALSMVNATDLLLGDESDNRLKRLFVTTDTALDESSGIWVRGNAGLSPSVSATSNTLDTNSLTINDTAFLAMRGGRLEVDSDALTVATSAFLTGWGVIDLEQSLGSTSTLFQLQGTLTVGNFGTEPGIIIFPGSNPPDRTLTINIVDADGKVDLDNSGAVVNINRNATLDINGDMADVYNGTMNLAGNATYDIRDAWEAGHNANININSGAPPSPSLLGPAAAHIAGGTMVMSDGTITLDRTDEELVFDAQLNNTGGTIVNYGTLTFNAVANFQADSTLNMFGSRASLNVSDGVGISIDIADLDIDGSGVSTNVITIGSGAQLDLDMGVGADESLTGTVRLNGGELDVTTADNDWLINGSVDIGANTGSSQINGETVQVTGDVNVGQNAVLTVNAPSVWDGGGELLVASGGRAELAGPATFSAPTSLSGAGEIHVTDSLAVEQNTTVNSSIFNWDEAVTTIDPGVTFTISVDNIDRFDDRFDNNPINVNSGVLNVTVADGEWELSSNAILNLTKTGKETPTLNGSALRVRSTSDIDVDGDAVINADVIFEPGGRIDVLDNTTNLQFNGSTTFEQGSTVQITNATATIGFNGPTTFGGGGMFQFIHDDGGPGPFEVSATVVQNGDLLVTDTSSGAGSQISTIAVDTYDWDSGNTHIDPNGSLHLNLGSLDNGWGGVIDLHNDLRVSVSDGEWALTGTLNLLHSNADVRGSGVMSVHGTVRAQSAAGDIHVPMHIESRGALKVDARATANLFDTGLITDHRFEAGAATNAIDGDLIIQSNAALYTLNDVIDGGGQMRLDGQANVGADATWNIATVDSDGASEAGVINMFSGVDLTINSTLADAHNSQIYVKSGTLNVANPWTLGNGGGLHLTDVGIAQAQLSGGELTVEEGASVFVGGDNGNVRIDAPITIGSSEVLVPLEISGVNSTLTLAGPTTLVRAEIRETGSGATVIQDGNLSIGDGPAFGRDQSIVAVSVYDWDQGNTVIEGDLRLKVGTIEPGAGDRYDATLTLNSGILDVELDSGEWVADGTVNLNNTTGTTARAVIAGDPVAFGDDVGTADARLNVGGTNDSWIVSDVTFNSDADVHIAAGAALTLYGTSAFTPYNAGVLGSFTGDGALVLSNANFLEVTTINMAGGKVQLGNTVFGSIGAPSTTNIHAATTINAGEMGDFGIGLDRGPTLNLYDVLEINLTDPDAEWTIRPEAEVNANSFGLPGGISGSDVNVEGTVNIDGESNWLARVDLSGTVNVPNVGDSLGLGGSIPSDPHRLIGGTVNGNGLLNLTTTNALVGFGTISSPVRVQAGSELRADDGTLVVSSLELFNGLLGTADSDGTLELNPDITLEGFAGEALELLGGQVTGTGNIINAGGVIRGHGVISGGDIDNGGTIEAEGGVLELATTVDFDGGTNAATGDGDGVINALAGDVLISGNPHTTFNFNGEMNIGPGRTFTYQAGAGTSEGISFATAAQDEDLTGDVGRLNLDGGTIEADAIWFAGQLNTSGKPSTARGSVLNRFPADGTSTLEADLLLEGDSDIFPGATFTGSAALINATGHTMILKDNVNVGVELQNRGTLTIGSSPGEAIVEQFTQTSTGTIEIEIGGTLPGIDHDELTVNVLKAGGTLEVKLIDGFTPSDGNTFDLFDFASVSGAFDDFILPTLAPQHSWVTDDLLITGELHVAMLLGDFNADGMVDALDYSVWRDTFSSTVDLRADGNGDGMVNAADYTIWRDNLAGATRVSGPGSVPEPGTLGMLLLIGSLGLCLRR